MIAQSEPSGRTNGAELDEKKRLVWLKRFRRLYLLLAAVCGLVAPIVFLFWRDDWRLLIGIAYALVFVTMSYLLPIPEVRVKLAAEESERQLQDGINSGDSRALLERNVILLNQYYALSIGQARSIFYTGLILIGLGLLMVTGAFLYIVKFGQGVDFPKTIVLASLAATGGILSNFVGAVYLAVYSGTIRSLTAFYAGLVNTHSLYFINFMTTAIVDNKLKEETFANIAAIIAKLPGHTEVSRPKK